jgi:hypothetical protein
MAKAVVRLITSAKMRAPAVLTVERAQKLEKVALRSFCQRSSLQEALMNPIM